MARPSTDPAAVDPLVRELRDATAAGTPIVCVVTHEERRASALLAASFPGARVASWTSTRGFAGDVALCDPIAAVEEARRAPDDTVVVMFDLHPYLADPRVVRALRDVAAAGRTAPLVLVMPYAAVPPELDRDARVVTLALPSLDAFGVVLDAELDTATPADREALARAALGLTIDEATRAFRSARALLRRGDANGALQHVIREKSGALRRTACLELIEGDVTLDDVGGLDVLKGWLEARVLAYGAGARAFGLAEPRGMLVSGVQGCGKSLVSKAAARVLGLPLVRLDFADVFAMTSPEHAIREAVRAVEAVAPVVLWVDEIEKGLGALEAGSSDARQARVFGAFLTWLQERRRPVFVAATANEVERLPPELARRGRFDEVFFVDLPSPQERAQILGVALRRRGRDPAAFPLIELARPLEHWSGAEIDQMVSGALFRAFEQRRELSNEHLLAAARELVPLATLYEEKIQALRQWGQTRARRASANRRALDLFGD